MDFVSGGESITALILQHMGALQKWSTLKSHQTFFSLYCIKSPFLILLLTLS